MNYSIRRRRYIPAKGSVIEILGHDGLWYFECEDGFESLYQAKEWFYQRPPEEMLAKYYIQGPHGGTYDLKRKGKDE